MITKHNIKKSQARHIIKLIEEGARAEVLARLGKFKNLEFADWYKIHLDRRVELLKYVFGTSSLLELAEMWGITEQLEKSEQRKIRKKKRKKK